MSSMDSKPDHSCGWAHFDHKADIGIRGFGPTPEAAFEQAALAMTAAITDPTSVSAKEKTRIHCAGSGLEDLLFDWLNALVLEMATTDMLFSRFAVDIGADDEGCWLKATAWGEPVDAKRHEPAAEVKGATYTAMSVRQEDGTWIAECVIDV